MTSRAPASRTPSWSERGSAAVDAGDLEEARRCFAEAVKAEGRNARHRFHLAVVLEGLGEPGAAGARLTEALRLDPRMTDAARRLSLLAGRATLPDQAQLDPAGLKAALGHDTVDREIIAEVAVRHLIERGPLGAALDTGRREGWLEAARGLILKKSAALLRDELFLEVLRASVVRTPDVERLLTAVRRVLVLEMPAERFEDRALVGFAIALMQQGWTNEYVWAVGEEEAKALGLMPVAVPALLQGDVEAGRRLLLSSLYRPLAEVLGPTVGPQQVANLRPRALREIVELRLAEAADERGRAAAMPRLGDITDATSRRVAEQYEASPYPRWTSVGLLRPADYRRALATFFTAEALAFMDKPFEVLIAGCGTGQHAVQAALAYGPNARVLALDLSAASLAYAARMAERFGATNISFAQADFGEIASLGAEYRERFQIVESTGVLHHMADPFAGWRALTGCLAPDGLMLVGLYSAIARRDLTALRGDPAYPGPGCDEEKLRAFRQVLMDRAEGELGGSLKISRDFYSASNFRDLTLHVSETCLTLPQIAQFLDDSGLAFRGFQLDTRIFALIQERHPAEVWPGSLARWAELEAAHPHLFNGMYVLWCSRPPAR